MWTEFFYVICKKGTSFGLTVEALLNSIGIGVLSGAEPLYRDLLLVSALGGLEGVECLKVYSSCPSSRAVCDKQKCFCIKNCELSVTFIYNQLSSTRLDTLLSPWQIKLFEVAGTIPSLHNKSQANVRSKLHAVAHVYSICSSTCVPVQCSSMLRVISPRHHPPVSLKLMCLQS